MENLPTTLGQKVVLDQDKEVPQALDGVLASAIFQSNSYVNRQSQSPLFSIIPEEIRLYIWTYALTAYEDPNRLYPKHLRCNRPGQGGALRIAKELLLTCKAIYLETYELPLLLNPISIYVGDRRDLPPGQSAGAAIIDKIGNYQFAKIQWLELSLQQWRLESSTIRDYAGRVEAGRRYIEGVVTDRNFRFDKKTQERQRRLAAYSKHSLPATSANRSHARMQWFQSPEEDEGFGRKELSRKFPARPITRLTIRLGRTDWWTWGSSPVSVAERLGLDPWITAPSYKDMEYNAQLLREGQGKADTGPNDTRKDREKWGMQVGCFPDLKLFEFVFETFAQKLPQLDAVVECAKTWTFPLPEDFELRWDGSVESSSWTGVAPKEYGYHEQAPWLHREIDGTIDYDKPLEPKFEVRIVRFVRRKTSVTYVGQT